MVQEQPSLFCWQVCKSSCCSRNKSHNTQKYICDNDELHSIAWLTCLQIAFIRCLTFQLCEIFRLKSPAQPSLEPYCYGSQDIACFLAGKAVQLLCALYNRWNCRSLTDFIAAQLSLPWQRRASKRRHSLFSLYEEKKLRFPVILNLSWRS